MGAPPFRAAKEGKNGRSTVGACGRGTAKGGATLGPHGPAPSTPISAPGGLPGGASAGADGSVFRGPQTLPSYGPDAAAGVGRRPCPRSRSATGVFITAHSGAMGGGCGAQPRPRRASFGTRASSEGPCRSTTPSAAPTGASASSAPARASGAATASRAPGTSGGERAPTAGRGASCITASPPSAHGAFGTPATAGPCTTTSATRLTPSAAPRRLGPAVGGAARFTPTSGATATFGAFHSTPPSSSISGTVSALTGGA